MPCRAGGVAIYPYQTASCFGFALLANGVSVFFCYTTPYTLLSQLNTTSNGFGRDSGQITIKK